MQTAIILFGHGARDPEWAQPMRRVEALVRSRMPEAMVTSAFLEFMSPTLADCVAGCVSQGAHKVVVLPMFIAQGGHLKRDLPRMLEDLARTHPDLQLELAGAVGEQEAVLQAMASVAISCLEG